MRFQTTRIALGAWLFLSRASAAPVDPCTEFTQHTWDPRTEIYTPNTTEFANVTERWNSYNSPTFSVAITPATDADVAQAVRIARSIDFPFLGTGGRHSSSSTLGALEDGLAIDLSALNQVEVDADAATLTIGGGTRFGEIFEAVYAAGFEIPTGSCACPGMVGATIGGGVGRYQGIHGLIIDSLLSVQMVTPEGELIQVSENSNPDLWWAIRGAAANFGIITSATYRLYPLTNNGQVMSADFIFPASANASYFDALESLQNTMPAELATISIMLYNDTSGEPQILSNWIYIGPEEEGRQYIEPLLELESISSSVSMVPWNEILSTAGGGLGVGICAPVHVKAYGANFRNLSSSTYQTVFQMLSDFYAEYPDGHTSSIEIEIFAPQAVEAVPVDGTAYPWRDSLGYTGYSFGWETAETERAGDVVAEQVLEAFVATSGYDGLAVYVSYANGADTLEEMYGTNLPRLRELKQEWDPENVFGFYHNLG